MSEHEFIKDLREKCESFDLIFTDIHIHIEKLVEPENIKFFYITKETRPDEKNLILDILIITNNSVCIGYTLYKDGRTKSAKFLMRDISSIKIESDEKFVKIELIYLRRGWTIVDTKSNEEKIKEFHLNMLSVWKVN